jgi:predicted MFS family arabinose efflux permease
MKTGISRKIKINRALSVVLILLGLVLLVYMIVVEDEPGALPLLFIIAGTIWLMITRIQAKKYSSNRSRLY